MFLQECKNDPRPARVVRMARALRTARPGLPGGGPRPLKKEYKITAGWAGPDMFCSRLAERGVKNTAGAR